MKLIEVFPTSVRKFWIIQCIKCKKDHWIEFYEMKQRVKFSDIVYEYFGTCNDNVLLFSKDTVKISEYPSPLLHDYYRDKSKIKLLVNVIKSRWRKYYAH